MGISQLDLLISDLCHKTVIKNEHHNLKRYRGKTVAFDVTNNLFPFLESIREQGPQWLSTYKRINTHLSRALATTVRLLENKIKPVYVFSGSPSPLRAEVLLDRYKREHMKKRKTSENTVDLEVMGKFYRRLAIVGKRNESECKKLFDMLGIPYVIAPGEAAAQCAEFVRSGEAFATVSEDINVLTFGSKVLIKHITFSPYPELPIEEFQLDKILAEFQLNQSEFIDLSILLGCDFCEGIRGMGRRPLLGLLQRNRNTEAVLEYKEKNRLIVSENWKYKEVRELIANPKVNDCKNFNLEWTKPDIECAVKYLIGDHEFPEKGIRNLLNKYKYLHESA